MVDDRTAKITSSEEKELISLTKKLIEIPSSEQDGNEIYVFVRDYFKKRGIEAEFEKINNPYVQNNSCFNLYVKVGNGKGPKIMLNGHLDTVGAKSGWIRSPFESYEDDGKIFGLGAADMKGGCAASIISLLSFIERIKKINGELFVSFVYGEEAPYSLGTDTLLREYNLKNYDLIIVTEPSPLLSVNDYCYTHKKMHRSKFPVPIIGAEGRQLFEIEFFGKPAHASHPSQGINALHDAARMIYELGKFDMVSNIKMGRGHYCILNIEGGNETFTVPAYCRIVVNRQLTLEETNQTVLREIKALIKNMNLRSKVKISKRYSPSPEVEYKPYISDKSEFIDRFIEKLPESNKGKRCRFTTSSVGDFNLFGTRTKVPVVVFGPGGGNIHAPNEYVNKKELVATTNYLLDFFMDVFK